MIVEIDEASGFCFGVVTAISKAEEVLRQQGSLYCLGDIVHNAHEVERLRNNGLKTITHSQLAGLRDVKVLLRAHGEPPATYDLARCNGVEIVDATCPVVLQLQRRVKQSYLDAKERAGDDERKRPQLVIYGKQGHAEVNGLVGQTEGEAIVIQGVDEIDRINAYRDVILYSQTTMSLKGFRAMVEVLQKRQKGGFEYFDTICRQVSRRMEYVVDFARSHDVVLFVSGSKSSNGKALYERCLAVNPLTFLVADASEVDLSWFKDKASIGITGATSTPRWLMEEVREAVLKMLTT